MLNAVDDDNRRNTFYIHLYGVANFAALLALRRGFDEKLAYIAGLSHDISLLEFPDDYENHCKKSSQMTKEILTNIKLFTENEIDIITNAVLHHNDIDIIHSPYDEILKDADIFQPFINDIPKPPFLPAKPRLGKIISELNIPLKI